MTVWDILDRLVNILPPIAATVLMFGAMVIFIVGFGKHGTNFLKYGFKQAGTSDLGAKIDSLRDELQGINKRLDGMDSRIAAIETNHFGHLKNFLTELTSILLDKNIINNSEKARLDNQLRDM